MKRWNVRVVYSDGFSSQVVIDARSAQDAEALLLSDPDVYKAEAHAKRGRPMGERLELGA
jgi:uncharacterized protein YciI